MAHNERTEKDATSSREYYGTQSLTDFPLLLILTLTRPADYH